MPLLTTTPVELGLTDAEWEALLESSRESFRLSNGCRCTLFDVLSFEQGQEAEEKYHLQYKSEIKPKNFAYMVARYELGKIGRSGHWVLKETE